MPRPILASLTFYSEGKWFQNCSSAPLILERETIAAEPLPLSLKLFLLINKHNAYLRKVTVTLF